MNKAKLISILKGAIIALSAGGTTALIAYLSGMDWSGMAVWVQILAAVIINTLRKYAEKEPLKAETDEQ